MLSNNCPNKIFDPSGNSAATEAGFVVSAAGAVVAGVSGDAVGAAAKACQLDVKARAKAIFVVSLEVINKSLKLIDTV